jgi:iron complex outermembrane receptor protein
MQTKFYKAIPAIIALLFVLQTIQAQEGLVRISGRVSEQGKLPLAGVSVSIKNSNTGVLSDGDGNFVLKSRLKFPLTLVFNYLGYEKRELEIASASEPIAIALESEAIWAKEVVVSASRVEESILKSPVAIEKLDIRAIKESPAASFYDALENVKGVQMTTASLTFKVPNTRGFNIPNNFRFMQLVDGVDMQAATLGVPLGNAIGPTELDIASVEITPGAASALYGMNAINGMANLSTKSPFIHQGLSVYQKVGANHVDGKDYDPSILTESAIRYAKAWNNRWAFKVNGSYLQGTDWLSNTSTDQNPQNLSAANPRFSELAGDDNPAADLWNRYGDERNNNVSVAVNYNGKTETFNVRRTGYWERDLINPTVRNIKFDAGLFHRFNDKLELSYTYRFGQMDGVFQRGNKVQLKDVRVQNHRLELKNDHFLLRSYVSIENTGKSYNLKPLADNLDLNNGSNSAWGTRFKTALQSAINADVALPQAFEQARLAADQGRVEPGTQAFEDLKNTITGINNWDIAANVTGAPATGGAWLLQKSRLYHTDFQWNLSQYIKWATVLVGADVRVYEVIPDGNNFVDFSRPVAERGLPGGKNQYYSKYGGFVQATKTFFNEKLKLNASLRVDQNPEFSPKVNPRVAVVYTVARNHNFRASYQNGWRFPALFEALSYVNNGNVRRVGGLPRINEGLGYLENSYTLSSIDNFSAAVNTDVAAGLSQQDAALKNRDKLQIANLPSMQPEHINAYEIGYKSVTFDNKLILDWEAYYNIYEGFLGQVEVAVPKNGLVGSDASVIDMLTRSKQDRYRVFTNARNKYKSYGSTFGLVYNFFKKFTISGNVNYNNITENTTKDVFITAFNTPRWVSNISFANREIARNVGFNVVWRWQDAFSWESPLANGFVPSYSTVDAQINVRIPRLKTTVKVGASNVLNQRYFQYAAGPTIGGLYYVSFTYDGTVIR